ncbi:carboxypeptidase-like regulatory domain-containing protein [Piscinibacter gummiphilus]|uniref:Uncharacterized protein n=1 Tax=Piscinibacter gummiphilus TaxID=946333 RepID=A0A1W6L6I5_9BURK|nr:carboxypeptidase-like regulatory domain-containing protein [Piscinibacter gummiphilus]ARN19790.1 hypothetical protein A4W93_07615 [Piscinibacter gummiphilus]ATU64461.1 carboxypeptidase regulatory-like domain-containing protein [Piscinibacter gummiphilus]GLS95136.1 hypothetical protein GCM10007918_24280 [Piscinibacter gummiphilus]
MRRLLLAACLAVSGCVPYPVYKELQPVTRVRVVDPAGRAVAGASVVLLSNAYPYGREQHRETRWTDASGVVSFDGRHEWRVESLMIHGAQVFFWNLCVEKPGYATHLTEYRSAKKFETEPTVVLAPGTSSACPTREENA